jgi:hypothetical protein
MEPDPLARPTPPSPPSDSVLDRLQDSFPEYLVSRSDDGGACAVAPDGEVVTARSGNLLEVILGDREFAEVFREVTAAGHPHERPGIAAGWRGPRKVPGRSRLPGPSA